MDNIIRTFEEKFADAGKLEKEVEQLKKLRADIDKKISEKMKSPLMWYNQHQEMLPQLQTEIKHLKDDGLEEPITFDDKMDYAITRSELVDVFSKHFVDTLLKDEMPFHGIAPIFGINISGKSEGAELSVEGRPQNIECLPSDLVMKKVWQNIIYQDRNKTKTQYIMDGTLSKMFLKWMDRKSPFAKEMSRRGVWSVEWKFLVDFLKHGTCSIKAGLSFANLLFF